MADDEGHFVKLVLDRRLSDAKRVVGEALASDDQKRTLERSGSSVADSSDWWIRLSKILDAHGRTFIAEAGAAAAEISKALDAYEDLREAGLHFLDFLSGEYERRYRANRHFYSPRDAKTVPLPHHWNEARKGLEQDLEIQRRLFSDKSQPASGQVLSTDVQAQPVQRSSAGTEELGEAARPPGKSKRKLINRPGPRRRTEQIQKALEPIFKRHHDSLARMSERFMHAFIEPHWPASGAGEMPAVNTIKAHWQKHLDARAAKACAEIAQEPAQEGAQKQDSK